MSHAQGGGRLRSRIVPGRAREVASRVHGTDAVAAPVDPGYQGLVTRGLALAVDAGVINLAALAVGTAAGLALSIFELPSGVETVLFGLGGLAYFVWTVAYFVVFWSTTGQTPGNRLLHIRVVRAGDLGPLRPRRAALRLVALMIAAAPFLAGFLPVLVDERRRGLHDLLARTVVIDAQPDP